MAKSVHNDVLDGALSVIRSSCTRMTLCSAEPGTFAQASATLALADTDMAPADFVLADGDTSGRKMTVAAKAGVPINVGGSATHIALLDVAASRLLYVTTCPTQGVAQGGTADVGSWAIEIADPA